MSEKTRILVVDDDAALGRTCARMFRKAGHEVVVVETAAAAWGLLQSDEKFDLLLTDVQMPGQGGDWLHERVNEQVKLDDMAVIAMTGNCDCDEAQALVAKGVPVIGKPFDPAELIVMIAQLTHG